MPHQPPLPRPPAPFSLPGHTTYGAGWGWPVGWESVRSTLPISPKVPNAADWDSDQVGLPKATWKGSAWWQLSTSQRLHPLGILSPEKTQYTRMELARTKQTNLEVLLMCAILPDCLSRGLLERGVWWACLESQHLRVGGRRITRSLSYSHTRALEYVWMLGRVTICLGLISLGSGSLLGLLTGLQGDSR